MDNDVSFSWVFPDKSLDLMDLNDKNQICEFLIKNKFQETNSMFEWKNLPPTIPQHHLEMLLQTTGKAGFIKVDNRYFVSYGNAGGVRNYNFQPTCFIVSNAYLLNGSKNYRIYYCADDFVNKIMDSIKYDGDCVVIGNDNLFMGLMPMNRFYSSQLAENIQTKRLVTILSRAMNLFVAQDDDDVKDFNEFISDLIKGEFTSVKSEDILARVKTMPFAENGHKALTDLIEDQQYIRAVWYNSVGLQANYNMKRESINSNESQLNKDAILPLPDNMLSARKLACKRINELFGLNIDVEFSSAWKYSRQTIEQAIEAIDDTTTIKNEEPNRLGEMKKEDGGAL